jgi:hypothetical protein
MTVSLGTLGRVLMGVIRIYTVAVGRGSIILAVAFVVPEAQAAKVIGDAVGKLFEEGHASLRYVTVDAKMGKELGKLSQMRRLELNISTWAVASDFYD